MGLTMNDLENLSYGDVVDMMIEAGNDGADYKELATQEDFDRFKRM
jgi:hypothetical protein